MSISPAAPHRMSKHDPKPEHPKEFLERLQGNNEPIVKLRSWQIMDQMTKKQLEIRDLWGWQDMGAFLDPEDRKSIKDAIIKKTDELRNLWNQLEECRYGGRRDV